MGLALVRQPIKALLDKPEELSVEMLGREVCREVCLLGKVRQRETLE